MGFSPLWYFLGIKKGKRLAPSKLSDLTRLAWDAWPTADDIAAEMQVRPTEQCVTLIKDIELSVDFVASIFNSGNISADKCASILNDINITADKAASILNSNNISVDKAAAILNSNNITIDKAAKILNSPYLDVSKAEQILKSAYLNADKAQAILYNANLKWSKLIDILTVSASSSTISTNTSISGIQRYRDLIIDSGITLSVDGQPGVIIAETITNNGTITKTPTGGAGGSPGTSPGRGGNGGGGLYIIAKK